MDGQDGKRWGSRQCVLCRGLLQHWSVCGWNWVWFVLHVVCQSHLSVVSLPMTAIHGPSSQQINGYGTQGGRDRRVKNKNRRKKNTMSIMGPCTGVNLGGVLRAHSHPSKKGELALCGPTVPDYEVLLLHATVPRRKRTGSVGPGDF
jgi:hypothetical protein